MNKYLIPLIIFCNLLISSAALKAAGPIAINDKGVPATWSSFKPVAYQTDQSGLGSLSNAEAVQLTDELFQIWQNVSSATISFKNQGVLSLDITGSNVLKFLDTVTQNFPVSPIMFDTDGSITDALLGSGANKETIGFAGIQWWIPSKGEIVVGIAVMNGRFQDGDPLVPDLTLTGFRGVFVHEFGHMIGMGHTQINLDQLYLIESTFAFEVSNVPIMFPIAVSEGETLLRDDIASVSTLYPSSEFVSSTGKIRGKVFLSDGITPFQGTDVIARNVANPVIEAVSSVSGFLHIDPSDPSLGGSSDQNLIGFYEITGLQPGEYIVSVEQIPTRFSGGSSVGSLQEPVALPGIPEFYNVNESSTDAVECASKVPVSAGSIVEDINIILDQPGTVGHHPVSEQEPNDSIDNGQAVSIPTTISSSLSGSDAVDYYSVTLTEPLSLSAFLSFQDSRADLTLTMLNPAFSILWQSAGPAGSTEAVGPLMLDAGEYFIIVAAENTLTASVDYTLDISATCIDDPIDVGTTPVPTLTPIPTPVITPTPTPVITEPTPIPTPTTTVRANLNVSFDPNPVSETKPGVWNYRVFVEETNGTGVTISSFQLTNESGKLLLEGDSESFAQLFNACGDQSGGFIPGFDKACSNVTRTGSAGVDTFTFFGIDENNNKIQASGKVTLTSAPPTGKSFTFKCKQDLIKGPGGLERLILESGKDEQCTVKLTHIEPGVSVEVSTLMRDGLKSSIKVEPANGITDKNGELEFLITAIDKGIDWIAWAVPNEKGSFEFSKKAYDSGLAWGMFVEVVKDQKATAKE